MKAVVCDRYGPPEILRLEEVERPAPRDDEVLVKVRATTVNRSDCAWRAGDHPLIRVVGGLRRPKWRVLGSELAGEVVAVGADVTRFAVGDRVFGVKAYLDEGFGAHAEYTCIRATGALATMPAGATFEQAAAVCDGALNALTSLRRVGIREGRSMLVYGASGSIGTAAVQLGGILGADVTAVCSTRNVELVRSLGASTVVDRTYDDFTRGGRSYDVIFDAVGRLSFRRCRGALKPGGFFIATDGMVNGVVLNLATRWVGSRRLVFPTPRYTADNALYLRELIEAGRYQPVIDQVYTLGQVVEATRYVETKHKTGNVVLAIGA